MKISKFPEYEKIPVKGRLRIVIELAKKQNLKNKTIVDVGSSNGLLAYHLLAQRPKKYIGIDPSPQAVDFAKKKIKKAEFSVSTADKLPLKDETADVALMFDVIEHVPPNGEVNALQEVYRVLKPNGKLLLSTPNNNLLTNLLDPAWFLGHRHYKPNQLKKFLEKSGFRINSLEVRGGLWFSVYLILLYISKWIFKNPDFMPEWILRRDDQQFSKSGIHTIFIVAQNK